MGLYGPPSMCVNAALVACLQLEAAKAALAAAAVATADLHSAHEAALAAAEAEAARCVWLAVWP